MSTAQRLAEQAEALGWTLNLSRTDLVLLKGDAWVRVTFRKDGKINHARHGTGLEDPGTVINGGYRYIFRKMQRISPSDEWLPDRTPEERRNQALKIVQFQAWPRDPVEVCLIATAAWGPFKTDRQRYAACARGLKEAGLL